jgi:hypothetical protein
MGLDWVPLAKPKPGHEAEFEELFYLLTDRKKPAGGGPLWKKVLGLSAAESKEKLSERFLAIPAVTPYEALNAPMVGRDQAANAWVKELYDSKKLTKDLLSRPMEDALRAMKGFYVVDLVPECDGIPIYTSGPGGGSYNPEPFWFRAKFLEVCTDALDTAVIAEAFSSKLAPELVTYGNTLAAAAKAFAKKNSVESVLGQRTLEWDDESKPEAQAHIVHAAAKWCLFWGELGHGMEANF